MKSSYQAMPGSAHSPAGRASSVLMGRQDYISSMLRLTGMELYKLRHRLMSKVLAFIGIISTVSLFGLLALATFLMAKNGTPTEDIRRFSESLNLSLAWRHASRFFGTHGRQTACRAGNFRHTVTTRGISTRRIDILPPMRPQVAEGSFRTLHEGCGLRPAELSPN